LILDISVFGVSGARLPCFQRLLLNRQFDIFAFILKGICVMELAIRIGSIGWSKR
jgi:hypothetical protein